MEINASFVSFWFLKSFKSFATSPIAKLVTIIREIYQKHRRYYRYYLSAYHGVDKENTTFFISYVTFSNWFILFFFCFWVFFSSILMFFLFYSYCYCCGISCCSKLIQFILRVILFHVCLLSIYYLYDAFQKFKLMLILFHHSTLKYLKSQFLPFSCISHVYSHNACYLFL